MDLKFYFIFILCLLFSIHKKIENRQKKIINLAFALDNNYTNYLHVSLISLFENSNNNTIYNIYIQISDKFENKNKELFYNLEKIYFNCIIIFIDMHNEFSTAIKGSLDVSTYYRLKLPTLLPKINRIIHIDGDTIILKDLMEFFTLNFERKYILGRLDKIVDELDSLGVHTDTYINCGVLLIDLYSLRRYNYVEKFMNYIRNNNNFKFLNHHDQTCINYICKDNIGILRPKYHMWPFPDEEAIIDFNNKLRTKYNVTELIQDFHDPFIVHFPGYNKQKKIEDNKEFCIKYNTYLEKSNKILNKLN